MDLDSNFEMIVNDLFDGVYVVDLDRTIRYWNRGAERLTGYRGEEVMGKSCKDNILVHVTELGKSLCHTGCPLTATMADGRPREATVFMSHKDGHRIPIVVRVAPLRDAGGEIVGAVEIFNDSTREWRIEERSRELEKMALIDPLTVLPNRRYVETQLESRFSELQRYGWKFGVIFMDIDHFKAVNDTYGHEFGDQALKMIAKSLSLNSRPPRRGGQVGRRGVFGRGPQCGGQDTAPDRGAVPAHRRELPPGQQGWTGGG